jgi:hypothetical protein
VVAVAVEVAEEMVDQMVFLADYLERLTELVVVEVVWMVVPPHKGLQVVMVLPVS